MNKFESICKELSSLIEEWEPKLSGLGNDVIAERRNSQNRTIKQITGHMVDSASNNTHRIIQNYQQEDWNELVQLWKCTNMHIVHVIRNINSEKLDNVWISGHNEEISLEDMVVDFPRHFKLHLSEIDELINKE